jgi:hypothetical protein
MDRTASIKNNRQESSEMNVWFRFWKQTSILNGTKESEHNQITIFVLCGFTYVTRPLCITWYKRHLAQENFAVCIKVKTSLGGGFVGGWWSVYVSGKLLVTSGT